MKRFKQLYYNRIKIAFYQYDELKVQTQESGNWEQYLNCTWEDYVIYIETLFYGDVNWLTWIKSMWELDHVWSVSHADLRYENEKFKAFNFKNTQPLSTDKNREQHNLYFPECNPREWVGTNWEVRADWVGEIPKPILFIRFFNRQPI